jgi:hypothetical protein
MEKKNKQTCGEWKENKKKHVGKHFRVLVNC